ncbi:MAG: hypothetical protein L3J95_01720 [Thermoplasmata archaeon]|nr:hypothetical protein [Thermoplasmata archaeon]MCI4359131.1 hypothetical protein [Thermoplasmata archaeon]
MKLQRVVNLKAYDKTYYKWLLSLPPTLVEQLGWSEGDELVGEARMGVLRIQRGATKAGSSGVTPVRRRRGPLT